jgi:hypothetical protein
MLHDDFLPPGAKELVSRLPDEYQAHSHTPVDQQEYTMIIGNDHKQTNTTFERSPPAVGT